MNLQDAQLCIDCEWIYADARTCPRCGSGVGYPVARALDRQLHSVVHLARPVPVPALVRPLAPLAPIAPIAPLAPLVTAAAAAVRDELEPRRARVTGALRSA
jgi:hypothetical protein